MFGPGNAGFNSRKNLSKKTNEFLESVTRCHEEIRRGRKREVKKARGGDKEGKRERKRGGKRRR